MLRLQQPQIVDPLPCAEANTASLHHILWHCSGPPLALEAPREIKPLWMWLCLSLRLYAQILV